MSKPLNAPSDVALFGGSFNPPHICHALASLWVLQTQDVDEVWWVPTFQHAFDKRLVDFEQRLEMCEHSIADLSRTRLCPIERDLGGESRTIDTVRALRQRHPETRFWLVIGTDILEEFTEWKDWRTLLDEVPLIIVGRRGYDENRLALFEEEQQLEDALEWVLELPDISSTEVRQGLAQGRYDAVSAWIARPVLDYIARHQLYHTASDS